MTVQIKICGTTSPADVRLSQEAGADFLGVILNHPPSPRNVSLEMAREIKVVAEIPLVILTVNQDLETLLQIGAEFQPRAFQLHGDEPAELVQSLAANGFHVWKAISGDKNALFAAARAYHEAGAEAILVDAREVAPGGVIYGGTGQLADWSAAQELVDVGYKVILAGGLSPENVERAVLTVRPWAVDVVSGVEARKGIKDEAKVREFVRGSRLEESVA